MLRGPPGRREQGRIARKIQALENGANHLSLGDESDELPSPLAKRAMEHVDLEHPLKEIRPGVAPDPFLGRDFIHGGLFVILSGRRRFGVFGRRCHPRAPFGVRGQHPVLGQKIRPGRGDEGAKLLDEGEGIEEQRPGPVLEGVAEAVPDPTVRGLLHPG